MHLIFKIFKWYRYGGSYSNSTRSIGQSNMIYDVVKKRSIKATINLSLDSGLKTGKLTVDGFCTAMSTTLSNVQIT